MNAIKRFFRNFKKKGTIPQISDNAVQCASNTQDYSGKEITGSLLADEDDKSNKDVTSKELSPEKKDSTERIKDVDKVLVLNEVKPNAVENPAPVSSTTECLKEFDEILEDFSRDITKVCVSLDEIENVIGNIKEEGSKESLFDIPRFDLQDLIQSFGSNDDSVEDLPINLDEIDDLNDLVIDLDETDESNESVPDETIHLTTENVGYFIEHDTNVLDAEVISISSEDSLANSNFKSDETNETHVCVEPNIVIDELVRWNVKTAGMEDEQQIVVDQNGESSKVDVKNEAIVKPKTMNNENEPNVKNENEELSVLINVNNVIGESKDFTSIDSDDCGYHSSDFEFITEDEAKMDGLIINVKPGMLKLKADKPKRVKMIEIAIDKFSGHQNKSKRIRSQAHNIHTSSEFKVLTDTRPSYLSKRLRTLQGETQNLGEIKTESTKPVYCSGQNNGRSTLRDIRIIRPEVNPQSLNMGKDSDSKFNENCHKHVQMNCTQRNNSLDIDFSGPNNTPKITKRSENMQIDCAEINTVNIHKQNATNLSPRYCLLNDVQESNPSNQLGNSDELRNSLEIRPMINFVPGPRAQENNLGYGPSNLEDSTGFKHLEDGSAAMENRPKTPDINHKRWRAFPKRNPSQIIHDHSYSVNDRMLGIEGYYKLFDPNFGPLPNQGIRPMENKSTVSTSMMLVEYAGVGFDMQMMKEWSESEEEEVKEEAAASARKIIDMYPGENRKRRRRY